MPIAIANFGVLDLRQEEAPPFAAPGQACRALAAELIDQRHLGLLGMAENVRADFAKRALIRTSYLLAFENGAVEDSEGLAVPSCHVSIMTWSAAT